jgi:hypothetical protein
MTPIEMEKIKTLLAGEDGKLLQSYADSRVAQALKTHAEKNPGLKDAGDRLIKIKEATDNKVKSLELKNKVIKACYDKKIDYEAVEKLGIVFNDESEIETKLSVLGKDVALNKDKELNEKLLLNQHKPQSSQVQENVNMHGFDSARWAKLSAAERLQIEIDAKRFGRR